MPAACALMGHSTTQPKSLHLSFQRNQFKTSLHYPSHNDRISTSHVFRLLSLVTLRGGHLSCAQQRHIAICSIDSNSMTNLQAQGARIRHPCSASAPGQVNVGHPRATNVLLTTEGKCPKMWRKCMGAAIHLAHPRTCPFGTLGTFVF